MGGPCHRPDAGLTLITWTDVDGVPTLYSPSPGPVSAGLVFRVGTADETLSSSGITHLVEHLALHRHGLTDYHYNGTTSAVYTHFHMRGSPEQVVAYLASVCAGLANLPLDRLETEKGILRAEAANRGRPAMPLWRYGAVGYGLVSYPEWGLFRLGAREVGHWARAWFTRDNAVLWVHGPDLPAGLRLDLPPGTRRPVPPPSSALPATPAYFVGDGGVVLDAVVRRRPAAAVFAGVLERELYRKLRHEGGHAYTAAVSYQPRGDRCATVTAVTDALPDQWQAALGGLVDVVHAMRAGRIDDADFAAVRGAALDALRAPDAEAKGLAVCAADLLTGERYLPVEDLAAEVDALGTAEVHAVAVEALGSALLRVPPGIRPDWTGFVPAPTHSTDAVTGTRHRGRDARAGTLVVGGEGVSLLTAQGPSTVRYRQCAAQLRWPDGGRLLVGTDGISVPVEPSLWRIGPETVAGIDGRVHPAAVIALPARDPASVPRPAAPGSTTPRQRVLLVVLAVLATALATCNGFATFGFGTDPTAETADWVLVGVVWAAVVALLAAIGVILLRARRRR